MPIFSQCKSTFYSEFPNYWKGAIKLLGDISPISPNIDWNPWFDSLFSGYFCKGM